MILTVAGGARSSRATPSLHEPHLRTTPYGNQQQIHLKSVENCPNKPGHLSPLLLMNYSGSHANNPWRC